jgi:hypothetical protein
MKLRPFEESDYDIVAPWFDDETAKWTARPQMA